MDRRLGLERDGLACVLELSPFGVVAFNRQGLTCLINDAALQMLGLNRAQHIGISGAALAQALAKKCLQHGKHDDDADSSLLMTVDEHPLMIKRMIKRDPSCESAAEVHYFYDITQETNASEMKTDLLFSLAHEFRSSLTSIHGYTELALKRSENAAIKEFLEIILNQSNRLGRMINDVLDLGRAERENIVELVTERFEVNAFVQALARDFFADRQVIFKLAAKPIFIDADQAKLSNAIINVFSNAQKYSAQASPISISTYLDETSSMVGIQVADKGIGMTAIEQSKLFTRFYRANPEGNIVGSGLGLCLVKEILELHAGGVEIHTQKNEGTQVTLWLPTTASVNQALAG